MRGVVAAVGCGLVVLGGALEARAEALFSSPPHFATLPDRQQVVLFLNEPVSGALASRRNGTTIEVLVPRSELAPDLAGKDFGALRWRAEDGGVKHLVMNAADRNTAIRIETARPIGMVEAHGADDPPRLVIELLASAPTPTRTPGPARSPGKIAPSGEHKPPPGARAKPTPRRPGAVAVAQAESPAGLYVAVEAPAIGDLLGRGDGVIEAASPTPAASPHAASSDATAPHAASAHAALPHAAAPSPTATAPARVAGTFPEGPVAPQLASEAIPPPLVAELPLEPHGPPAPAVDPATVALPSAPDGPPAETAPRTPCRFRRVRGVGICVPDPRLAPYTADPLLTIFAIALNERGIETAALRPGSETPARLYLEADESFVRGASTGRLLDAVSRYQRALRQSPGFVDAARARINVALAYRTMRLWSELGNAALAAERDPDGGMARALVGDLAREQGSAERARAAYARARELGGFGGCLAIRGEAALAVDAGELVAAEHAVDALAAGCPDTLLRDPETELVRARVELLAGKAKAALARLQPLRGGLGVGGESELQVELAGALEATGDDRAARRLYESVANGRRGDPAARRAAVRLAFLDGAKDGVQAGIDRLDRHLVGGGTGPRRTLYVDAIQAALARGDGAEAMALVDEAGLEQGEMSVADRLLVARAYRAVGMPGQAARVLAAARHEVGPDAPTEIWAELGDALLAGRRTPEAIAHGDAWVEAHGPTPAAEGFRARARAAGGDTAGALAALAAATAEAAPDEAARLQIETGIRLATGDPAAAVRVLRSALDGRGGAALDADARARALRALAGAAEASGDGAAALAAFTELAAAHAAHPAARDATYRAARLATQGGDARVAGAAWEAAAAKGDPLARRVATALKTSDGMLATLGASAPPKKEAPDAR